MSIQHVEKKQKKLGEKKINSFLNNNKNWPQI